MWKYRRAQASGKCASERSDKQGGGGGVPLTTCPMPIPLRNKDWNARSRSWRRRTL